MKRTSLLLFFFTVLVGVVNLIVFVSITEQPKVAEAAFESYKVTPIILVPSDKVTRSEYPTAVNQSMANVRDWYVGQSGLSFNFDNVTTLNSTRPTSYFGCNEDLPYCIKTGSTGIDINLVLADIDSLIGPRRNNLDRVIFMIGAGPVAVGTVGSLANTYNYAFFGESTLDALSGRLAPEEINRARGSLAHELGHNFGLSHPDSNIPEWENVMGIGWLSYPKVIINNTILAPEMNYLKKSPFLAKQAIPSCTPFKGGHLSITTNTILCPGVYTATGSSGGVISIDANNVTLDASNATFWGDNTNSPNYGLTITGRTNVTVTNLRMSGYFYAVKVENSSNVNIINSIFNKNRQTDGNFLNINIGFPGEGGGIVFRNVTDSSVVNNVLDFQNTGIHLYGSNQNLIEGNSASFNKTWGVALNSSDSNNVLHNDTRHVNRCTDGGCDSAGILLVQGSDDNTIEGNNMNYSGDGFFLGNGTAPLRTSDRNIVRNNLGNYSPNNGFEATFSTLNVFEDNEANFNNYGFWLGYSHNNSVNNNIISSNKTNGIEIEQGRDNQITNNLFKLNGVGAYFRNSGQINSTWPGSEVSNNYNINNNSFVANTTGLHLNNVQDSFVQNNNFSANGENIRYSDKTKATLRVATSNNNITCFSAGGGASNLILNKPSTSNVPGGGGGTSPAGANDGDSTDPTKTFYFGQVHVGDWWRVDMGSSQTINALVVYSWATNYNDIPHKFHLETSTTGNFSGEQLTVATELGWDLGNPSRPRYRIYTFPNVVARYIRFVSDIDQLWTHLQEIEAYNDPNITNTYSPDVACNYNFYNNLATSVTTNLSDNYWEFAPKVALLYLSLIMPMIQQMGLRQSIHSFPTKQLFLEIVYGLHFQSTNPQT